MVSSEVSKQEFEHLQHISGEYLNLDSARRVDQRLCKMIVSRVEPWLNGPKVLEMGFGDNVWTDLIIQKYGHAHIVDASEVLLDEARRIYGDRISTFYSLFEDFIPYERFDTVLASYVLEHVIDPVSILKKSRYWLKEMGQLVVIVPNATSLHRMLSVHMGIQKTPESLGNTDFQMGHRRVYTLESLRNDISKSGYCIVEEKGLFLKLLPNIMMTNFSNQLFEGLFDLADSLPIEYAAAIACLCKPVCI